MARADRSPLVAEFMPFPGRGATALRVAAVSVLVVLVSMALKIPETAVSVFLVFFLQKPDSATTVLMCIALSILLPLIVGIVLLLAILTLDYPAARVAAMALMSFGILWLSSASKLGSVGNTIGLVVAYGLDLLGKGNNGELVTRGLLYALQFTMMPLAVLVAFNLPFGRHPERLARKALADRLERAAVCFEDPGRTVAIRVVDLDDGAILKWIRLATLLRRTSRERAARLNALTPASRELLIRLAARTDTDSAGARSDLAVRCRELAARILDGQPNARPDTGVSEAQEDTFAILVAQAEAAHATGESPPKAKAEKSGFLKPGAVSNPDHIRYALKTTAAAMACYFTYAILDWPGIHTCMITCFVGSLLTVGETTRKLVLRLSGCLVGAALGLTALVFVLPQIDGITGLLVLVAVVALPSAWITTGSERIAYMGIQIAFAFCLCVLQGFALKTDLTVARDRLVGIVFGDLVIFLVATRLYPISIVPEIEESARRFLAGIRAILMKQVPSETIPALAPSAFEALQQLKDRLDALGYEPAKGQDRDREAREMLSAGEDLYEQAVRIAVDAGDRSHPAAAKAFELVSAIDAAPRDASPTDGRGGPNLIRFASAWQAIRNDATERSAHA